MFKITKTSDSSSTTKLKLEGKLGRPWVAELLAVCNSDDGAPGDIELDLSGLSYVDPHGLLALRDLIQRGVVVRSTSPFITELLYNEETP